MIVPVTWFQVVNQVPISRRYSSADSPVAARPKVR